LQDHGLAERDELAALSTCRYVHITGLEYFLDEHGRRCIDPLWHKDLMQHLRYLPHMTLVAGHDRRLPPPPGFVPLEENDLTRHLRLVPVPYRLNWPGALLCAPVAARRIWRAVDDADLVFAGFIEWPIPIGWIATPIVRWKKKPYYTFLDSAFWRLPDGVARPIHRRVREWFTEKVTRMCMRRLDLAFITNEGYRDAFRDAPERAHLIHASWIDEANLLTDTEARAAWREKTAAPDEPLRLLFVGRLVEEKGVRVLLDAFAQLDPAARVQLDILGTGELERTCVAAAAAHDGDHDVRYLGSVPYEELFGLIGRYHAVVVPSVSDEQPRIVYDAFSQAVPVIASDTFGLRDCVDDATGFLVPPNDPVRLARAIERAATERALLERAGMQALRVARRLTHTEMHRQRRHALHALVSARRSEEEGKHSAQQSAAAR
jgi:glycosyltransferase involved in cell wall biosynthesis